MKGRCLFGYGEKTGFRDRMNKWFSADSRKKLPWISRIFWAGTKALFQNKNFQNKMVLSLDLISFIFKIQSTAKEMWVLSVSKRETALETKMRGIKMRTKKNKQYNVLLEKH